MLYPLLFKEVYKKMIWGSESWGITCRPNEMGVIENGPLAGESFAEAIRRDRTGMLGTRLAEEDRFPLLVKIIDAQDNLSVQVHPDDAYAFGTARGDSGKNEMWYIIKTPEDGCLIIGLKDGVTREALQAAHKAGATESCLNRLPVKQGDIVDIPSGLIHALTRGVMVAEVQQNSDITYRLYDYNRKGPDGLPRELHPKESFDVIDFDNRIPVRAVPGLPVKKGENRLTYTIANRYFAVIKYEITTPLAETSDPAAFSVFTCVEGEGCIIASGQSVPLPAGRSVFIPAGLGSYEIQGDCVLLKSFVPDIAKDFITPLEAEGYSEADIATQTALNAFGLDRQQ